MLNHHNSIDYRLKFHINLIKLSSQRDVLWRSMCYKPAEIQKDRPTARQLDRWRERQMDRQTNSLMDGWTAHWHCHWHRCSKWPPELELNISAAWIRSESTFSLSRQAKGVVIVGFVVAAVVVVIVVVVVVVPFNHIDLWRICPYPAIMRTIVSYNLSLIETARGISIFSTLYCKFNALQMY